MEMDVKPYYCLTLVHQTAVRNVRECTGLRGGALNSGVGLVLR